MLESHTSVWTIKTAKRAHDCDRCRAFITRGMEYYARELHGKTTVFCLPCGGKISDGFQVTQAEAVKHRAKRKRRAGEPLLGPGHVVHGLRRMGA